MSKPNKENACSGRFKGWLEILLTDKCNGNCSWCVEKEGYHPNKKAQWQDIAIAAINTRADNIMLLGGEPTMYPDLKELISVLCSARRKVYLTTNGGILTRAFVKENLPGISGINLSIHSYNLRSNEDITGIKIDHQNIANSVDQLHQQGATVRLNCNCIKGHISSEKSMHSYLEFAKNIPVDSVKFGELKNDIDAFVDINKMLGGKYGLNDDPFILGCTKDANIDGIRVNFRQMCGIQTPARERPTNPEQNINPVLYYDGQTYNGWQTLERKEIVTDKELIQLLEDVASGEISSAEAALAIGKQMSKTKIIQVPTSDGSGCRY